MQGETREEIKQGKADGWKMIEEDGTFDGAGNIIPE
jgi:hypothetical protein